MASHGLRDQDKLDGMSNFVIWRARILTVLDQYDIKDHAENVLVVPVDPNPLKKFKENQARAKHLIMDEVKDHVVPHIVGKNTTNEIWTASETMYQEGSVQRKMLLENQMWLFQMQKGEQINPFLFRLQTIWD